MRSLFLRIFIAFWAATTLVGVAFALIYAYGFPSWRTERRQHVIGDALRHHAGDIARCLAAEEHAHCEAELERIAASTGMRIQLYRGGERVLSLGAEPEGAPALARELMASGDASDDGQLSQRSDDSRLVAVHAGDGLVAVGEMTRTPTWVRYLDLDTLPQRIAVLFLVAGLLSYLLARYLTRPLRTLRAAAQRLAGGDFAARVSPELASGGEIGAVARDFDRMAERIEHLLDAQQQLLRDVSHELRSPLARLRVALEIARQRSGADRERALDRIEREAERLADLIGQVLTVTALETRRSEELDREIDFTSLCEEVVRDADFEARGSERRVELVRRDDVKLGGNEEVLRRAVDNVLRNAVRFTAPGTAVEVSLTREDDFVELAVRDHGPGVPEEALVHLFEPFYRVDSDRDRRTGGMGLGLAITARAVSVHGGSVRAENAERDAEPAATGEPSGGLRIVVRLPLPQRVSDEGATQSDRQPAVDAPVAAAAHAAPGAARDGAPHDSPNHRLKALDILYGWRSDGLGGGSFAGNRRETSNDVE